MIDCQNLRSVYKLSIWLPHSLPCQTSFLLCLSSLSQCDLTHLITSTSLWGSLRRPRVQSKYHLSWDFLDLGWVKCASIKVLTAQSNMFSFDKDKLSIRFRSNGMLFLRWFSTTSNNLTVQHDAQEVDHTRSRQKRQNERKKETQQNKALLRCLEALPCSLASPVESVVCVQVSPLPAQGPLDSMDDGERRNAGMQRETIILQPHWMLSACQAFDLQTAEKGGGGAGNILRARQGKQFF